MKNVGTPLEIKISISTLKGRRAIIKTPYLNLGPDWGSDLVDAEGESGESQLCQSTRKTKKVNLQLPLYVETKHTNFVATIFFFRVYLDSRTTSCPVLAYIMCFDVKDI
jgi:hypothetical protein